MSSLHSLENHVAAHDKKHEEKQLARRIAIFLATRGDVGGGRVAIDVADGLVTLSGVVATAQQKQQIEFYCLHVAGVFGVTNRLEVDDRPIVRGRPRAARESAWN